MTKENVIKIIAATLSSVFILLIIYLFCGFFISKNAIKKITVFPEYNAASVIVFGQSEDTISAKIDLYDVSGKQIAQIERSWNSTSLDFDFLIFKNQDKSLVLPYRIYSDRTKNFNSGVFLKKYLIKGNKNIIFDCLYNQHEKKYFNCISNFSYLESSRLFSKNVIFKTVSLSGCIPGKEYALRVDSNGEVNLLNLLEN